MTPLPITALYAAGLALFYLGLSSWVVVNRWRAHVGIGDGGDKQLGRAIRVHGNFAEYVPFALLLIALCEAAGAPLELLHALGAALAVGRVLHAIGLGRSVRASWPRAMGVGLTWAVIAVAAGRALRDVLW